MDKICDTCRYNQKCLDGHCCVEPNSPLFTDRILHDDTCKEWEQKKQIDAGTDLILTVIWEVAKTKPEELRDKYAEIMKEVFELEG